MNTKPHQHTGGGSPKRTFPPLVVLFTILAFVTTVIGLPFVPTNAATTPAAVTDSTYYAPQDPVDIYAAGFTANSSLTINFSGPGENGSSSTVAATAKADGTAGVRLKLDSPWQPGSYKVTVTNDKDQTQTATTQLTVMSAPSAKVEKTSYAPTDRVTLLGTGFAPQSTVDVELSGPGSTTPLNTLTANADGAVGIAVPLSVDAFPAGAYTLKLTDQDHPTLTASTTFSVTAPVPTVSFEKTDYSTKDAVKVYGYNFTPKTEVTITLSGPTGPKTSSMDVTATTDDNGNVGRQFNPPTTNGVSAWEPGAYTVTIASKTTPAATASASFTATAPAPTAATDKENYGTTGQVTIVGKNFTPNGKVTFTLTGPGFTTTFPQDGTANPEGQVAQVMTLKPEGFDAGSYTVTLTDKTNPALTATTHFSVFTPAASTNKTIYGASEALQAFGTGFAPNSTLVFEITGPTGAHSSSSTVEQAADSKGAAGRQFSAPKASEGAAGAWEPGTYTVKISDKANAALTASANITVFAPQAATDKENYGATDRVGIIGTGYAPNSKVTITLTGPGDTGSTTTLPATTNGEGNVAQGVKISDQPWAPGAYTVTITDDTNTALTSTTHFAVLSPTATTDKPNYAVGEKAIITGDKFAPNSTVEFTLTGPGETGATTTLPQDGTANSAGKVAQALTLTKGTFAPGIYTVKLTDKNNASLTASVTFRVAVPSATADKPNYATGQSVTVSGSGFAPESDLVFELSGPAGERSSITTAEQKADKDGALARQFNAPKASADAAGAWEPGTYTVTITDKANKALTASVTFTVVAPSATTDQPNYAAGQKATLSGDGFAPGSHVSFTLSGPGENGSTTTLAQNATANADGKVAQLLTLNKDAFTPGTYTVTLTDTANEAITATTTFTVVAPTATTDKPNYAAGQTATLGGEGFAPNTTITYTLSGPGETGATTTLKDATANGEGKVALQLGLKAEAFTPGTYTVTLADKANPAITASTTFNVLAPKAATDEAKYAVGDSVAVSGSGFAPETNLLIELAGPAGERSSSTTVEQKADAQGGLARLFKAPVTAGAAGAWEPGTYTVTITDKANEAITASVTFTVNAPTASADKPNYAAGENAVLSGEGFAPKSTITFTLSGAGSTTTLNEATANGDGAVALQLGLKAEAFTPGTYTITLADKANPAITASTTFNVVAPTATTDKPNYAAGENAVLSGEGFAPKSTITFTLSGAGSTTTLNEATANGDGAVALQLGLKAEAFTPGTYTVTLADKANPAITASTTFNVLAPKAATDKDSYAVGDSVKVSGSGFAPESDLVFELSGPAGERSSITTAEQKADKDGALARQFNAPKASADAAGAWEPGTYTVTITDKANKALTASVTFTVVAPTPTPTPTTAAPATQAPSASASPSESASTQPSTSAPATVAPSSSAPNEAHSGLAQTGATGSTIIGLALLLGLFGTAAVALQRRRGLLH